MLSRWLDHLFGYRSAAPRSTGEMSRVLRAAAQFSDTADVQAEYTQAADALDRVITLAARHSDAPTRDAMAYALGRAELDLGDKLTELIETGKETHIMIQAVQDEQARHSDSAGAAAIDFQAFVAQLTEWRDAIERWRTEVDATLKTLMARLGSESDAERAANHQAMCDQIADLNARLKDASERIQQIETLLVGEGPRVNQAAGA